MKLFVLALLVVTASAQRKPDPAAEQQELNTALAEAGNSQIDFIRALENHLTKYPASAQRTTIEAALAKAAIETKDDRRILLYGERVLATNPDDLQILDRVIRTLLITEDRPNAEKALAFAIRDEHDIEKLAAQTPPSRYSAAQWSEEIAKGIAHALVYEARATGNMGKVDQAIELSQKAYERYPSAAAAREWGRWLARSNRNPEAVQHIADAFTIEDPASTEMDRGKDRVRMGELYTKANGSEKGLGDVILQAYDRTQALVSDRLARLKAQDPNAAASKITDFTLTPVTSGSPLVLSSLHGKVVVMDFWATWCGPCKAQHPLYEKVQQRFKDDPNVVFLAVATDEDRSLVAPILKERKWTGQNYFDAGIAAKLDVSSIPTTIVVGKDGNIASRMNGFVPERFVDLLTDRIKQAKN